MKSDLLSVIIPIYNTDKYLNKCIDSVINQTYNNLEIILVDDGSTDKSPEICDYYGNNDNRIKVIHKKNGGLSDARNTGVSVSTGEYLVFLDSDDYWLDNSFIENAMPLNEEDIVFFGHSNSNGLKIEEDKFVYELNDSYSSGNDFVCDVLKKDHVFYWYAWRYIIKASIWKDNKISFPVGENYEDSATMFKPLLLANKINVFKHCFYCYENREKSITRLPKLKNYIDHLSVIKNCINNVLEMKNIQYETKRMLCDNFASSYIAVLIEVTLLNKNEQNKLFDELKSNEELLDYIVCGKQLLAKKFIKVFGLRLTSYLLSIRRMIKYNR